MLKANTYLSVENYRMMQNWLHHQQMFVQSEACSSCVAERTRAIERGKRENTLRTIMGPVGGGGPGFGQGMVNDPVIKSVGVGILTAPLSGGSGAMASTFTSFGAFGKSLVGVNSLRMGLTSAAADFTIQTAFQIGQRGTVSLREYNATSIIGNGLLSSPLTPTLLGSGLEFHFSENPLKNSVFGEKPVLQMGVETGLGTLFNLGASKAGAAASRYYGKGGSNYMSNLFGNQISTVSIIIYNTYIEHENEKENNK